MPKGVYPRRRPAKPAKPAAKPAAPVFKTLWDLIEADAQYIEYENDLSDIDTQIKKLDSEIQDLVFKGKSLLYAQDSLIKGRNELECTSTQEDELIENATGTDQGTWYAMNNRASEDLLNYALDTFGTVCFLRKEKQDALESRQAVLDRRSTRIQELRTKWDAMQSTIDEATK
jgi:hypothetical protein